MRPGARRRSGSPASGSHRSVRARPRSPWVEGSSPTALARFGGSRMAPGGTRPSRPRIIRRVMTASERPPQPRRRARELGVRIGLLPTGTTNSIVDVTDVAVGHRTVWRDEPGPPTGRGIARTGVTAIVPFGADELFEAQVPAGAVHPQQRPPVRGDRHQRRRGGGVPHRGPVRRGGRAERRHRRAHLDPQRELPRRRDAELDRRASCWPSAAAAGRRSIRPATTSAGATPRPAAAGSLDAAPGSAGVALLQQLRPGPTPLSCACWTASPAKRTGAGTSGARQHAGPATGRRPAARGRRAATRCRRWRPGRRTQGSLRLPAGAASRGGAELGRVDGRSSGPGNTARRFDDPSPAPRLGHAGARPAGRAVPGGAATPTVRCSCPRTAGSCARDPRPGRERPVDHGRPAAGRRGRRARARGGLPAGRPGARLPLTRSRYRCGATAERGSLGTMVLPGGPDYTVPLAIAPDDLRQLADHDAQHRSFAGGAGPLVALDTGGEAVRGTALLVAGYTGSKEDFAPLARAAGRGRIPGGRDRPARAVRVARSRRPGRLLRRRARGRRPRRGAGAARGVRRARCTCSGTASAGWSCRAAVLAEPGAVHLVHAARLGAVAADRPPRRAARPPRARCSTPAACSWCTRRWSRWR